MKLCSKEKVDFLEGLYYKELAAITDGYTGSDLKVSYVFLGLQSHHIWMKFLNNCGQNLCITAAYRPVKELIQKEREQRNW